MITYQGRSKALGGQLPDTTSLRMELTAVVEGLRDLPFRACVEIRTDCMTIVDGIQSGKVWHWRDAGWRHRSGRPVLDVDLWSALLLLCAGHDVTVMHVKGHAGHSTNELADALAKHERARALFR